MIVLDTSFILAYQNSRDVHHASAVEAMKSLQEGKWGEILLPEYVFLETVTVLAARRDLKTAGRVGKTLLHAEEVRFVPCSDYFVDAFENFQSQENFQFSFTDAAIVTIAVQEGAEYVATFDEAFRKLNEIQAVPE